MQEINLSHVIKLISHKKPWGPEAMGRHIQTTAGDGNKTVNQESITTFQK